MKFFYWASEYSDKLQPLLKSARANAVSPERIGENRIVRDFHNSLFKQQALFEACRDLARDDVVCAVDGFDVFFQQGSAYVLDTFLSFDCDVIFSAERAYSHQYRRYKAFFDANATRSPYRYLNAGSVIGYAWAIEKIYRPTFGQKTRVALTRVRGAQRSLSLSTKIAQELNLVHVDSARYLSWFRQTDQAVMGKQVAAGKTDVAIELDRNSRLFWCTALEWDDIDEHYIIVSGKLHNKHTGEVPAIIHVPWDQKREVFEHLYGLVYAD